MINHRPDVIMTNVFMDAEEEIKVKNVFIFVDIIALKVILTFGFLIIYIYNEIYSLLYWSVFYGY